MLNTTIKKIQRKFHILSSFPDVEVGGASVISAL
jgi:hypothetical protein